MSEQNFKHHARYVPVFHFFVLPVLIGNFLVRLYWWIRPEFRPLQVFPVLVAAAILLGFLSVRLMINRLQDRLIRLEERLRFERLLPPDCKPRIQEFTPSQLVALRFASDEELPELARKALDEKLTQRKTIKQLIKNWRPDNLRA